MKIEVKDRHGTNHNVNIYDVNTFPYDKLLIDGMETIRKKRKSYKKIFGTFDIETTSIRTEDKKSFGYMYIWQMCINGYVIIGRRWEEWTYFLDKIKKTLNLSEYNLLVIYVHYLPFEFQFIRNIIPIDYVFAREKRQVILANSDCFEFRCSHALTNMSLLKFTNNSKKALFTKMNGEDFDYSKIRTADTILTNDELGYCFVDVFGLWESLNELLIDDTITSIPMTSTGYVRREYREKMLSNKNNKLLIKHTQLSPLQYAYMKSMSRGGNCHANPLLSNTILKDVDSWDITSSYPFVMMTQKFPMSKFKKVKPKEKYIGKYACIIDVSFYGIECKDICSILYISKSKCGVLIDGKFDNGRVISAEVVRMAITDIDYRIIVDKYKIEKIKIHHMEISDYEYLPQEFRLNLLEYFKQKTSLKGIDDYLYMKSKNRINSSFGMMLTDILNDVIIYCGGDEVFKKEKVDIVETLNKYYNSKKSFLAYQWGVWVTAWARHFLQMGIDIVGHDIVYVDTDSVKHLNDYTKDFIKLNAYIMKICENAPIKAYIEFNGKREYLGVWEHETEKGRWLYFKTLGAKKYLYIDSTKKYNLTLSGVNKTKGSAFFKKYGFKKFDNGTVVTEEYSGRSEHTYNDYDDPFYIEINGCRMLTASNIGIVDNVYTIGMTEEYEKLLEELTKNDIV